VLQENVIIMLERGGCQGEVTVSHSTDDQFTDITTHTHPFDRIVFPGDPKQFIYVPESTEHSDLELLPAGRFSLKDLDIGISTGPVVDFRLKDHITDMPEPGTVPLLYARHFSGQKTCWPKEGIKLGNAIKRNFITERKPCWTGCC
jgi:adenine-specific DNA-methyltransferase